MTTFLLLLKYFFWSVLCTLLQVVFLSVTKFLLEYNFRVLFTPLRIRTKMFTNIAILAMFYYITYLCHILPIVPGYLPF